MKTISILGCGWLGLPLGSFLVKKGFKIKGSTTLPSKLSDISEKGIEPFLIHFSPAINEDYAHDFFKTDLLFINIPPGRKNLDSRYFIKIMKHISNKIIDYKIKKIIFISSTSVYPDINERVNEDNLFSPEKESGNVLMKVEKMLLNENSFTTSIIRFGGLIGRDRNPGRFLAGKKDVPNADAPVNLIHIDDCIGIIHRLIKSSVKNEIYNACMPDHPTKKEFYSMAAKKYNLPAPLFKDEENIKYKIVDSMKLEKSLNYSFIYKNPLDCI